MKKQNAFEDIKKKVPDILEAGKNIFANHIVSMMKSIGNGAVYAIGTTAAIAKKKLEDMNEKDRQARQAEMQRNLSRRALSQYGVVASLLMRAINSASEVLNLPHVKYISQLASKSPVVFTASGRAYLEYTWFYRGGSTIPAKEVAATLQDSMDDFTIFNNLPRVRLTVQYRPNHRLVIRIC